MVISDVIERQIKGLWGTDFADESNGIPVIKTNNMSYEGCIDYGEICYRNIDAESAKENYLHKGDLLVEKSGGTKTHTVGYVNHFDGDDDVFVCNNFILGLRPKKEMVNYMYLFYQLRYMYELGMFSDCYNKTTGIQNLQVKAYLGKSIVVPNMVEQNAVVKALDTIQKAIDLKRKQLEDLDELVKSKFQEMFGDPVENEKGWDVKSFGELATFKNGLNYSPKGEGVKYYIIGVSDFQSRSEISCNEQLLSVYLDEALNEEYLLQDDDILFVRSNGNKQLIARNILVKTNMLEVTFSGFCIRARIVNSGVLPCFVNSLLKLPSSHNALTMKGRGCNISNLNQVILNDFGIIVPPMEQQKDFAEFARKADAANAIIKQEISDLEELMDSKMDEYFG